MINRIYLRISGVGARREREMYERALAELRRELDGARTAAEREAASHSEDRHRLARRLERLLDELSAMRAEAGTAGSSAAARLGVVAAELEGLRRASGERALTTAGRISAFGARLFYEHRDGVTLAEPIAESAAAALCDELLGLAAQSRYRAIVSRFAEVVATRPGALPEEHWRRAAHYNLALALTLARRFGEARAEMALAELPAGGDHDALLYPERFAAAYRLKHQQELAIAAGRPSVMITALPKSGSAFVSNSLARLLGAPVLRAGFGGAQRQCVLDDWARQIARGGAVTHEHYELRPDNLEALARAGVRRLFVQLRDPRAALWSLYHHELAHSDIRGPLPGFARVCETWYGVLIDWLRDWLRARDNELGIEIVPIHYEAVRLSPIETLARILSLSGAAIGEAMIRADLDAVAAARGPENFRAGDSGEWRRYTPPQVQERLWDLTPPELREALELAP